MSSRKPILIAGPTASGKSDLALKLAEEIGGAIINADSQQVYAGWRVLSARPSLQDETRAPHYLYGSVAMDVTYSTGHWLRDAEQAIAECARNGLRPIIVGGTGLYFKALTEGLAPVPQVPSEVRAAGEALLEKLGRTEFAAAFAARDPGTAARIDLENPRRVLRAWEVLESSGTGLSEWQARTPPPLVPLDSAAHVALTPPREWLYERCETRFDIMLSQGALEEARAVIALGLPPEAPSLRAVGAPELAAHLRGEMTLSAAVAAAKQETRRYAKRQMTWIRNQMADWVTAPDAAAALQNLVTPR